MNKHNGNWHEEVFFGLHYDQHARADDTVLGRGITYEHIRERLLRVQPDWIQWDCKGHPGYTSWPTAIGSTSPGVVKNGLKIVREVTAELGIKLGMHYSGVWDTRALELHPEWAAIDCEDKPQPNYTCRLSGYVDELMIPQLLEVIDNYDVDGFWVDGDNWAANPCWCERCQQEFTTRTGIAVTPRAKGEAHWNEWLVFHRRIFEEYVTKYADAVHQRKANCLVCSNWMYTARQPDPVTAPIDYISGDYTNIWGAERAAFECRVIDNQAITWDLMCWSFYKSGGTTHLHYPWTMKTAIHLKQEVTEVIALGGAIMLYDVPQRSGHLTAWHQDLLAEIATFCRARQTTCFKTSSASEIAILHLDSHYYASNQPLFLLAGATDGVEGVLHALLQNQLSADIITAANLAAKLGRYKLLVVPEQSHFAPVLIKLLTEFVRAGGQLLMSGTAPVEECPELVGAKVVDAVDKIALPVADRAIPMGGKWLAVTPDDDTEILSCYLNGQDVEYNATVQVAVTRRSLGAGTVTVIHGDIFENYLQGHLPLTRQYIKQLIDIIPGEWLVEVDGPSWLEVILRSQAGALLINLLNRGAGYMTNDRQPIIDELPPITAVTVKVKSSEAPISVQYLPDNELIDWSYADGCITINIDKVEIHNIIKLKWAGK